jgi:hypothetical protein
MNQPPDKERLQATLRLLDNLLIAFGVVVAAGLIGEEFRFPHFGSAVTIGVTAEAILTFLHVRKSRHLEVMQELEITAIKRDAAEANRLAEQDRLARVQIEERLAPRLITDTDRQKIVEVLKRFANAGRMVDMIKYPDDAEVSRLTHQLFRVLTDSGWKPRMLPDAPVDSFSGITVEVAQNNLAGSLEAAKSLVSSFSTAGLNVNGPSGTLRLTPTGAAIRITVGQKW